jgi:hypothetical protein
MARMNTLARVTLAGMAVAILVVVVRWLVG